jgi:hypothetical protein
MKSDRLASKSLRGNYELIGGCPISVAHQYVDLGTVSFSATMPTGGSRYAAAVPVFFAQNDAYDCTKFPPPRQKSLRCHASFTGQRCNTLLRTNIRAARLRKK